MAFSDLNDAERQALMKLAYTDKPSGFAPGDSLGANIEALRKAGTPDWVIDTIKGSDNLQQLTLKAYDNQNDTTGFKAYAFTDETGDVGFSFCGTEEMSKVVVVDNFDNAISSVTGESFQTDEAWDFYTENRNPASGSNWGFGHSKGANLATSVFVRDSDGFGGVQCVNGQPINVFGLTLAQVAALNSDKYDFVVVSGDFVSMLGLTPFPIRYVQNNGTGDGLSSPHDLESAGLLTNGQYATDDWPYIDRPLQLAVGVLAGTLVTGAAVTWAVGEVLVALGEIASRAVDETKSALEDFALQATAWLRDRWNATVDVVRAVGNVIKEFGAALQRRLESFLANLARVTAGVADMIVASVSGLESALSLLQAAQRDLKSADDALNGLLLLVPPDQMLGAAWADWRTGHSFRVGACAAYVQQAVGSLRATERNIATMAATIAG